MPHDPAVDMFLPAYLLMGMSGKPTQLSVLSCANEFTNPSLIMTIYSGVYSGSALIFSLFEVRCDFHSLGRAMYRMLSLLFPLYCLLTFQVISRKEGLTHKPIFLAYTAILAIDMLAGMLLLPPR